MFDAVVLADSPHAGARVLGLTLAERGRRVAARAGARRVLVVDGPAAAAGLPAWHVEGGAPAILILRAGDQLVHTPLVEPLLAGRPRSAGGAGAEDTAPRRIAVGPDGAYAGALWVAEDIAGEALAAVAAGATDAELAARWPDAARIPHGAIARHPARTPEERKAAARLLLRILVKPEDSPVTRYLYRPVSRPLTRLLVGTPITPNQVSYAVAVLGLLGCWFTARPGQQNLVIGAALVLAGGFIDGCDGEISRLRLTSSKLGAWLDTVVDELTTTVYFGAIGYHTYLHHPDLPWLAPSIVIGLAGCVLSAALIYYFLIVVSKTGNSQHYIGDLEIVESEAGVGLRARRRVSRAPAWAQQLGGVLLLLVRRDFVNLMALVVTFFDGYFAIYLIMLAGVVIMTAVLIPEHLKLRRQLRELARRGAPPRLLPS